MAGTANLTRVETDGFAIDVTLDDIIAAVWFRETAELVIGTPDGAKVHFILPMIASLGTARAALTKLFGTVGQVTAIRVA